MDDSFFPTGLSSARNVVQPVAKNKEYVCTITKKSNVDLPKINVRTKVSTPQRAQTRLKTARKLIKTIELSKITYYALSHPNKLPINVEDLTVIEKELKEYSKWLSKTGDYDGAAQTQRILNSVTIRKRHAEMLKEKGGNGENIISKRIELQNLIKIAIDEWNKSAKEFNEITRKEAAEIYRRHQIELQEFDNSIPQDLLPQFRKDSSNLREIKDLEHRFALNQEYIKANKMKEAADKLTAVEYDSNMQKMLEFYDKKRNVLIEKHNEQIKVFLDHTKTTKNKLLACKENMIAGYQNRLNLLDKELSVKEKLGTYHKDGVLGVHVTKERINEIAEAEQKFPIPRYRPCTSFISARK